MVLSIMKLAKSMLDLYSMYCMYTNKYSSIHVADVNCFIFKKSYQYRFWGHLIWTFSKKWSWNVSFSSFCFFFTQICPEEVWTKDITPSLMMLSRIHWITSHFRFLVLPWISVHQHLGAWALRVTECSYR